MSEETEKSGEMEKIEQILKNDKDEVSEMRNSGQGGGGRSRKKKKGDDKGEGTDKAK